MTGVFLVSGSAYSAGAVRCQSLSLVDERSWRDYSMDGGERVFSFDGTPRRAPWVPPELRIERADSWEGLAAADLLFFRAGLFGVTERAMQSAAECLVNGELLDVNVGSGERLQLFHSLDRLPAFLQGESTVDSSGGAVLHPSRVKRWVFDPACLAEAMFFRVSEFPESLFATERVVAAIGGAGLDGLRFRELWNDEDRPLEAGGYPWESVRFTTVRELLDYERSSPVPGEQFDETLYSLLAAKPLPVGVPESVADYFAQRVIQYRVVFGGLESVLADADLIPRAAAVYSRWGRDRVSAALVQALALVPALAGAVADGVAIPETPELYRVLDEISGLEESLEALEAGVDSAEWYANRERLDLVRQNRAEFAASSS